MLAAGVDGQGLVQERVGESLLSPERAADGQLDGERADARPPLEPAVRVEDEIQQVIHVRLLFCPLPQRPVPGVPVAARRQIILRRAGQGGADICDVDHPDQACFAGHRQVPEMPGHHGSGRVPDACRRVDDGRIRGYQGADPEVVDVLAVRHGLSDVSLGDDADGLLGLVVVHDHQSRHARVLHQVRGRGDVVARFYRGRRGPHDVRGGGRSTWRPVHGRLLGEGFGHDPLCFRGTPTRSPRSVSRPYRRGPRVLACLMAGESRSGPAHHEWLRCALQGRHGGQLWRP